MFPWDWEALDRDRREEARRLCQGSGVGPASGPTDLLWGSPTTSPTAQVAGEGMEKDGEPGGSCGRSSAGTPGVPRSGGFQGGAGDMFMASPSSLSLHLAKKFCIIFGEQKLDLSHLPVGNDGCEGIQWR